jgi:hypothetical protein
MPVLPMRRLMAKNFIYIRLLTMNITFSSSGTALCCIQANSVCPGINF